MTDAFYEPSKVRINLHAQELYRFQVGNSMFDEFIKNLLRIYGGTIFDQYQSITDVDIGRKINKSAYDVRGTLMKLAKLGVLHYIIQHDTPQISFLSYRFDAQKLPINYKGISELKLNDTKRLNKMVTFLDNTEQCKTYQLAAYFDEYLKEDCGVCDYCFSKKKS